MKKILVAAVIALGVSAAAQAAGDAEAGKNASAVCAGCHNADGNSMVPSFPKLAGQHASYIVKQLADFKAGDRNDPVMSGMAMPLSDKDMEDLAAYFASQEGTTGTGNPELVALGEKIYRGGNKDTGVSACIACHGPSGAGNPAANFPALAGQHAMYIAKALNDFKSGARTNDAGQMMHNIASKMSDAEINAVAEYITGLKH